MHPGLHPEAPHLVLILVAPSCATPLLSPPAPCPPAPAPVPQKYRGLMNFLSNVLREDGGFEYKKAIVDAILVLIRDIPEAKEMGLAQLCEFIEDCEFTFLSVQILHLLGEEGPRTKDPGEPFRPSPLAAPALPL